MEAVEKYLLENRHNYLKTGSSLLSKTYQDIDYVLTFKDIPDELYDDLYDKDDEDEFDYKEFANIKVEFEDELYNFIILSKVEHLKGWKVATDLVTNNFVRDCLPELEHDKNARVLFFETIKRIINN